MRESGVPASEDLCVLLGDVARALQAEPDVETTLTAIVKAAVDHLAGAQYAGVSLLGPRRELRTVAPTDAMVSMIDSVQYQTGQGPCVDAITRCDVYRTGNLAAEVRWPAFTSVAAQAGVRSMLAYRLFIADTTLGALNLYSRDLDAFDERTEHEGELFATHAAVALMGALTEAQLHATIETRDVIGMAKGILMQRHDVDEVQAFRMLVETSQNINMKLRQVAAWLVAHRREL